MAFDATHTYHLEMAAAPECEGPWAATSAAVVAAVAAAAVVAATALVGPVWMAFVEQLLVHWSEGSMTGWW